MSFEIQWSLRCVSSLHRGHATMRVQSKKFRIPHCNVEFRHHAFALNFSPHGICVFDFQLQTFPLEVWKSKSLGPGELPQYPSMKIYFALPRMAFWPRGVAIIRRIKVIHFQVLTSIRELAMSLNCPLYFWYLSDTPGLVSRWRITKGCRLLDCRLMNKLIRNSMGIGW